MLEQQVNISFSCFLQVFTISPVDGNVIVKRELTISQVAKYMRFYPTGSSSEDVPRFCMRVEVYGRDGKSVSLYCKSSVLNRVFTKMNVYEKGVSHLTDIHNSKILLSTSQLVLFHHFIISLNSFHLKHSLFNFNLNNL